MSKEMVISANPHETRVAILEEGQLCEYYVEREKEFALVGSIYKGRVTRVLPGMQSAFVEIGLDSDAFLYVSDFLEEIEELDHVVTTVEDKAQKMEEQGGQVFPANTGTAPIIEPLDVESPRAAVRRLRLRLPVRALARNRYLVNRFRLCAGHRRADVFAGGHSSIGGGAWPDRGRFENRSRGGRPGGDRGGRFGRRGGGGGGRGRSGGGGRPGGDRGGVLGANFPLRNMLRRGRPRTMRASRERRKDTSRSLLPGNLSRSTGRKPPSDISAAAAQTHSHDAKRRRAIRLLR